MLLYISGSSSASEEKGYSDSEYDAEVARYADSLKSHALNKLDVDESEVREIHPIVLGGYDFYGADRVKEGKDKKWRSNIYKVIMLFFTSNEVHCCTIRFKTTENLILGEATDVYFYQDIVSVFTYSDNIKVTYYAPVHLSKIIIDTPEFFNHNIITLNYNLPCE